VIQTTSEIFGVRKSVGTGLLAKAVGQVRRCQGRIFSRASASLQVIQTTSEIFGVRKSVGAGLLANAVGQVRRCHGRIFFAGKRAPTLDPGSL
jgi:ABC-type cobalt transport system substrate-binding protein